jgi:hypothetical protein
LDLRKSRFENLILDFADPHAGRDFHATLETGFERAFIKLLT